MFDRTELHKGMVVRNPDGDRIGKVVAIHDDGFEYTKGLLFKERYFARYSDIRSTSGGALVVQFNARLPEEEAGNSASRPRRREAEHHL